MAPKYCFICKRNSEKYPLLSFFRFPKEQDRCLLWLRASVSAANRPLLAKYTSDYCYNNLRICARHFEDKMLSSSKNRLNWDAVPVIFDIDSGDEGAQKIADIAQDRNLPGPSSRSDENVSTESCRPLRTLTLPNQFTLEGSFWISKLGSTETSRSRPLRGSGSATSENIENIQFSDVICQTPASLTATSPRKVELRNKIQNLRKKLARKELSSQHSEKKMEVTADVIHQFFDENYSKNYANFIKTQMDLLKKSPRGAKYSNEYKQFALTMYFLGPKVYKFLAQTFRLPSKSTLFRVTNQWPIQAGLTDFTLSVLKNRVNNMKSEARDCFLCIDEMSIKPHLYYNISRDDIIGFHEINGKRSFSPANNALVLMLRGINYNWKQPLAYFLINSSCGADDLKIILYDCIKKLNSINVSVHGVVSDQGSNFYQLIKKLEVTVEKPYFYVEDRKIYYMFDIPHLLKATRNNFFKYRFQIDHGLTNKKYLEDFYIRDKEQAYKLAPKLTERHINPNGFQKMKVKYASQVFSATVVAALNSYISFGVLPAAAKTTVEFIDTMDKLFDIMNSSTFKPKKIFNKPFRGTPEQIEFLKNTSNLFKNIVVRDSKGKDITNSMKFLTGWQLSISAFLNFWNDCKESGAKYVFTRRFNQDSLENFFGKIRQQSGNCRNPTPRQFVASFKKMCALNYFSQSEGSNCVDELEELLAGITPEVIKNYEVVLQSKPQTKLLLNTTDYSELDLIQKNAFYYVGGYFLKKCLQRHSCDICTTYAKANSELNESGIYSSFRAYENAAKTVYGNLNMPHEGFFSFLGACENIFANEFLNSYLQPGLGLDIKTKIVSNISLQHPCAQFPYDFLISVFVRTRIYYTLKFLNRDLRQDKSKSQNYKLDIVRHL